MIHFEVMVSRTSSSSCSVVMALNVFVVLIEGKPR